MTFPDLPLIRWDTFISRVRIRWAYGIVPESFAVPGAEEVSGTLGLYRKQEAMKTKKAMPKPATKKGKGSEKKGKKGY